MEISRITNLKINSPLVGLTYSKISATYYYYYYSYCGLSHALERRLSN
ncbi:MAG: hypothetical protein K9N22_08825 [Candidatus Marinimicrobia bacterium]|nr:hypothetical protein [Candidatus Neomarinimicrobiota bacterium]